MDQPFCIVTLAVFVNFTLAVLIVLLAALAFIAPQTVYVPPMMHRKKYRYQYPTWNEKPKAVNRPVGVRLYLFRANPAEHGTQCIAVLVKNGTNLKFSKVFNPAFLYGCLHLLPDSWSRIKVQVFHEICFIEGCSRSLILSEVKIAFIIAR